jgi:type IV pilus assembly protein PilM
MEFLPKALGTRPRLAVEVRTEGVVAARAEDAAGLLVAVSRADVPEGAVVPGLKLGNVVDRAAVTAAVRSALDGVAGRGSERTRYVTVIVPDAAVRVLLLDFDSLPGKIVEALPVVRFRLKKLLPFEVEDAVVSYQVMASSKGSVAVLAVAIPREVLAEYEGVVTSAGYVPGAVLPSTLAALAGLGTGSEEGADAASLLVNAGPQQVTTAIVRGGVLLLHRTLEMGGSAGQAHAGNKDYDRVDAEAAMQAGLLTAAAEVASAADEVAQAVSVAAAYFEDTLSAPPEVLLAAGTTGAEALQKMLETHGLAGLQVREMMGPAMLAAGAPTASVPRGWLAGVKGALTS